MYLRLMISMLFSHIMAANLICDFVDIDLYEHGNVKTNSCECHICYDSDTNQRVSASDADTIHVGKHWHKLKLIDNNPNLNLHTVLSSAECPFNRSSGALDSDDIVTTTSLLHSLVFQDKLCRRTS